MSQPFTHQEVKDAVSCMSPLKFQGPDGYPALFFHKYWHILVSNVIDFVLNYINIILIPKIKKPQRMTEIRPISLCNVLYKICSKALANRLKPALDLLIFPPQ